MVTSDDIFMVMELVLVVMESMGINQDKIFITNRCAPSSFIDLWDEVEVGSKILYH